MKTTEVKWSVGGPQKLPDSIVDIAKKGDSAYGPGKWETIKPGPLDVADTAGVIGKPSIGTDYSFKSINKNANTAGPHGMVETTYDHTNRSAKFEYPNVHQSIPLHGGPNEQYNDHN